MTDRTALFRAVCEELQKLVPFDGAALLSFDPSTTRFSLKGHQVFNSPTKTLPLFCENFAPLHPLIGRGFHMTHFNDAMRVTDALPAPRLAETAYSRDFQSRVPMFYELCAAAWSQGDLIAGLCFHRSKQDRDFTGYEKKILTTLMPHLSLAFHNISLMETIANSHKMGLIILGEDKHPLYMNEEARAALNGSGAVKIPDPQAIQGPTLFRTENQSYRIRTVQKLGKKTIILLDPLRDGDELKGKLSRFGFTPRQGEIAALVVQGLSNDEIAERLCIAKQTVKDHIQAVFEKAKVHHRAGLIAKVMGFLPDGSGKAPVLS
jgi:DNA-binding CsgD family transcriptional regulator